MSMTVRVLENTPETGLKVCPECFSTTNMNRLYLLIFFCISHKKEMRRSVTHFTQQNVFFPVNSLVLKKELNRLKVEKFNMTRG
jgi:hypothetical protein